MANGHGGARPGSGRRRGGTNANIDMVRNALRESFTQLGKEAYLRHVGETDPKTYCALLGKLLPAEIQAEVTGADGGPLEIMWRSE